MEKTKEESRAERIRELDNSIGYYAAKAYAAYISGKYYLYDINNAKANQLELERKFLTE